MDDECFRLPGDGGAESISKILPHPHTIRTTSRETSGGFIGRWGRQGVLATNSFYRLKQAHDGLVRIAGRRTGVRGRSWIEDFSSGRGCDGHLGKQTNFHPAGKLSRDNFWRTHFAHRSPNFNSRQSGRETAVTGIIRVPTPFLAGRQAAGGHEQSAAAGRQ
jgi:hypothetical protein